MTDTTKDDERKKPLTLARPGRLELKKTVETGQIRQSFSHGRSKAVTVEVRKKRTFAPGEGGNMAEVKPGFKEMAAAAEAQQTVREAPARAPEPDAAAAAAAARSGARTLTEEEKAVRARALQGAIHAGEQARIQQEEDRRRRI